MLLYWAVIVAVLVAALFTMIRPFMVISTDSPVRNRDGVTQQLKDSDVLRIDFVSSWDKIPDIELFIATFEEILTTGSVEYEFYSSDIMLAQGVIPYELLTDNSYVNIDLGDNKIAPKSLCYLILRIRNVSSPIALWSGTVENMKISASVNEEPLAGTPIIVFHVYKADWVITWDLFMLFSILLLPAVYLTFRNKQEVQV